MSKIKLKNVLGAIIIVIVIIMLIFIANTFRKYFIIKEIEEKVSNLPSNNYYAKTKRKFKGLNESKEEEFYTKDGKWLYKSGGLYLYNIGNESNQYTYDSDFKPKVTKQDVRDQNGNQVEWKIYPRWNLEKENDWQTFLFCMRISVNKINYKDKECYVISEKYNSATTNYYYEKDTGIFLKWDLDKEENIEEGSEISNEREYEFDNVLDEIFTEPDINQFTIEK